MQSLKIDNNPFISATIDEYISHINQTEYKAFMGELFGTQHQYLNGLDRVAKVAEQFKPVVDDGLEVEARRLIDLVRGINHSIFKDSENMSIPFSDLINQIKLDAMITKTDLAILNAVKPHREAKLLISEINTYQDGNIQLQAFIDALKYSSSDAIQIANPLQKLRIKNG